MSEEHRMTRREAEELRRQHEVRHRIEYCDDEYGEYECDEEEAPIRLTRQEAMELERRREQMRKRNIQRSREQDYSSGDEFHRRLTREEAMRIQASRGTNSGRLDGDDTYRNQYNENIHSSYSQSDGSKSGKPIKTKWRDSNSSTGIADHKAQNNGRPAKRKSGKGRKVLIVLTAILAIIVVLGVYAYSKMGKLEYSKVRGIETAEEIDGYTNIALFGVDSREGELTGGVNSDTIIIASINDKTKETKLVSVYRDTYLQTGEYTYDKANSAYCYGGAVDAVNMLNNNLDLDIECFMTINFSALVSVIDILGGLDIDMTAEEVVWMNGYVCETSEATGVWSETLDDQIWDGVHHLNGIQATSYCRIRYTEGNDFRRTERQRLVLSEVIQKAKRQPWKLNKIMNEVFPQVYTNISRTRLLSMGLSLMRYKIADTSGFPYNYNPDWRDENDQSQVVPIGLEDNVVQLHEYLFPDVPYTPSENLQEISNDIIWITGEDPAYY